MPFRFRTVLAPLLLSTLALASACAGGRVRVAKELEILDSAELTQRTILGHVGAYGELENGEERARAAARLAAEYGNDDEAASFANEQLELARTRSLIARLRGDAAEREAADENLDEAARFAVRLGDDILDARLVVEAAQFLQAPKRERKRIARALALAYDADLSWGYDKLFAAFERDAAMLAALQRLRWRSYQSPGMPYGAARLAPETFAKLGPESLDLMWTEADRAATERRLDDLERWVEALLDADRFDPDALAIAVVLDALANGRLEADAALLPDLAVTNADPLGVHARMLLRQQARPQSRALALFRANAMLASGTFGDAGQLLAELEQSDAGDGATPSKHEEQLQAQIAAMVAFESGTAEGRASFERWRRKARAGKSRALADWLSSFEQELAPEGHVELARAADRRLVGQAKGRGRPQLGLPVLASAAIDADSRPRVRERALAGLVGRNPGLGSKFEICRERKLFDADCRDLIAELNKLDYANDEYSTGLDALGGAANVRAQWFSAVPSLDAEQLPTVRERLGPYEGTRAAATTDYQAAALFAELAANRPDLARARLDRYGEILRPETRAVAFMALRDLEDGLLEPRELPGLLLELPSADIEAQWFIGGWLPGDPAMVAELFPGRSRLARFARGLALARMGAWPGATAELLLAVDELEGQAKGVVAGRLAYAAELAGEPILRDRALGIAEAEDPLGFMAPFVRAQVAESVGALGNANALYLQALARRPQALLAFEGAIRTMPLADLDLDRVREALLLFPDPGVHWFASELFDAAKRGEIDGPMLTALWLAREDGDQALALGEPAAKLRPTTERGLRSLLDRLEAAQLPADAFPLAAKTLAWIGAMPPELRVQYREIEIWLTFLIGRDSELEALVLAQPRTAGMLERPASHHATLLLADARSRHAVDDVLAWSLVREKLFDSADPLVLAAVADLYAEIEDPALAQYACLRMFERDELDVAAQRCVPLWNELGGSPFLAVDLAYLVLNDPERARAHGLDIAEFFASATKLPALEQDPVWLLNASLWASKRGDDQRGAELRVQQLALDSIAPEPDSIELGQARYRGALLRQQIVDGFDLIDRRRFALAAASALRSIDLVAADLYAQRLLAWLPEVDDEAEFTAQSPQLLAATRPEGEISDAELRSSAFYTLALGGLIRDDLDHERIPVDAMRDLLDSYSDDEGVAAYERIARDNPRSHVAKLLLMAEYSDVRMREAALVLARELIGLHPHDPLVLADALPLLTGPEDLAGARALLIEARLRHPDHPWLHDEALPSVLTGAEDRLPPWLRTPEEFERRLANVDGAALLALAPTRRVDFETSAEAFFAAGTEPNQEGLGIHQDIPGAEPPIDPEQPEPTRVQFVVREPRASRCEGLACAEPLIAEWTARNYALLWTREVEVPAGRGVEFLVADGESVIDNLLIPSGGNLFVLISGSTPEDFGAFLPQVSLLREGFRPLDWSLSAATAEGMRSSGRPLPDDPVRFRGRQLLDAITPETAASCPLSALADAKLTPETRGELILDLFLATREPWQRRALLACTKPDAPEAARLAFVSLLDDDALVYEFGRAATKLHAERVVTDTRRVLYQERVPAVSNPALTTVGDQPPFGLLQVIAALPREDALALTREMLGRRDPRLRALALAASGTMDYYGPTGSPTSSAQVSRTEVERLREVVRAGEAKDALLAARSLMDIPGPDNVAAIRDRADTLIREGIADENSRGLAVDLAWALARLLDAKDTKRLRKLAEAVDLEPADDRPKRAEGVREAIDEMAKDHAEGRKLLGKRETPTTGERAQRWARENKPLPAPRSLDELAKAPLAELVPGREWSYVRVGNAGLFATSLEALLRRLAPANPADAYLVRTLIYDMLLQGSFALLGEDGGLDLTAPIECVSPKGSSGFACSASVKDRAAVLSNLARREIGDDAGVSLPLSLTTEFAGLPMLLGALPVSLHSLIEAPEDELEPDSSPEVAAERLRMVRTVAGHELEYYATVEIHENRIVVDSEHYLFVGDRLFVFGGSDLAEQILRAPPKGAPTLASDDAFAEAVAGWRDGVALQAVDFTDSLGLPKLALEVVLDNQGIEFSATASGDRRSIGEYDGLDALLPNQHVAAAALALEPDALREYFEDADLERCARHGAPTPAALAPEPKPNDPSVEATPACGLGPDDKMPPYLLAEAAPAVLLGWYPEPGDALWQRWVLVMPLDAKLRRAIKAGGAPLPGAGELVEQDGLVWQVRDDALIVASDRALAEDAKSSPAIAEPAAAQPFARFALDGQRAAAVVRALAERYDGGRRGDYLRIIATMIGLVDHVELSGAWTGAGSNEGELSATVALNLAKSEEELALIDRWLASPEVGNASKLPRHLGPADTETTLSYTIRVDDAEQFARTAVPKDNPRVTVEILGPDQLRLTVRPSRAVAAGASQALSAEERERKLGSDGSILAQNQKIREVANGLRVPGDDAATVDAIVSWVHDTVKYEITPTSLDAITILERGEGDCTEYALLTVTLLRAAGIPAELREGMAASGDEMVAHAWAAWHDGTRWHEVDPTAGTSSVSSGHLELDVVDVLAMISLGQFEVVAIESPTL